MALSIFSYFPDKLFTEKKLLNQISDRLAPIRAEEAEARKAAQAVNKAFGKDQLVRSDRSMASQADAVKFKAEGSSFIGTLTIHSTTAGKEDFAAGHSWLEIKTPDGEGRTLSTWGNTPLTTAGGSPEIQAMHDTLSAEGPHENGLFRDLEKRFKHQTEASRTVMLDEFAMLKVAAAIKVFEEQGDAAWTYATPCSGFASIVWEAGTGERLADENLLGISTPHTLRDAIKKANSGAQEGVLVI